MSYDTDARSVAAEMLDLIGNDGFGQTVVVTQPASGGTYDPATGGTSGGSPVSETGSGVIFDYPISLRSRGGQGVTPGTLILEGDKNLLLSPLKADGTALTEPKATWTVTINGNAYTLISVGPLSPAGTTIYYDLPRPSGLMAGPFEMQLRAFGAKALANYDAACREAIGNFAAAVIDRSPVGDPSTWKRPAPAGYQPGQFVANWRLGVGAEVGGTILAVDPGRTNTKDKIKASIPEQASGKTYYFTNPLPYAWRLEMDGWSHQAPFGFLQVTITEWNLLMYAAAQNTGAGVPAQAELVPA